MKNLLLIQPNRLLKRLYPRAVWNFDRNEKTIYLTFDDGPIPVLTEWVLDELQKWDVKATFFCVGANILKNPSVFNRITSEGHLAANHTMHHIKGFKCSVGDYMMNVEACEKLTGNGLFRPPYGQLKRGQYKALVKKNYQIVLWDVISYDFEEITPQACEANVMKNAGNGSIVLFHDNIKADKNVRHALPIFLEHFKREGFSFRTLGS